MYPVKFPEANQKLLPPAGQEQTVSVMWCFNDGKLRASKWKPTFWEKVVLLFGGSVWFMAWNGNVAPVPVALHIAFDIFEKPNVEKTTVFSNGNGLKEA